MLGLGYDGDLFILAFDHRGSFVKKFFGVEGDPSAEETQRIADAKTVIFEGFLRAVERLGVRKRARASW
jgi:5-dehydro-2-deoxygluconokinase